MMRKITWTLLAVVAMVLAACGPATMPVGKGKTESGEMLLMALPRIVIDVDAEGKLSTMGIPLEIFARLVNIDLSSTRLDKRYIDWATAANLQHIELRHTGAGVALLANGKALPHLAWTEASLKNAVEWARAFDIPNLDLIARLLPAVPNLGLDLVLRFPLKSGAAKIELADPAAAQAALKPEPAPESGVLRFEIKYDDQGVPSLLGISARELQARGVDARVALAGEVLSKLIAQNIQYMEVRVKSDGLYLYANGQPLPNLAWDNALLVNAAELYAQLNPTSPYIELVKQWLPGIAHLNADVLLHFPRAAGAAALPIETH